MTVSVNPPKTPITTGSNGLAIATVPNVCKMPGPPAPFVPTPLPNIARSGLSPKGFSKSVKIEGKPVAVRGSSFASTGDIASKGTGGGLVSANAHGPIKFVGPGSMNVKIEGKNVQLLGDPVLNNCGPSGSPPNSATMAGVLQACGRFIVHEAGDCPLCGKAHDEFIETEASKTDAGGLHGSFGTHVHAALYRKATIERKGKPVRPKDLSRVSTMLGVVECECGRKYADQSSSTTAELCAAARDNGMRHVDGAAVSYAHSGKVKESIDEFEGNRVKADMLRLVSNKTVFELTWKKAVKRAEMSLEGRGPIAYTPGFCAAQGALVLARDDGGFPTAMTEVWYSSAGRPTGGAVPFIDNSAGQRVPTQRGFQPGETVPPCGTCELLVPLMLCTEDGSRCQH